MNKRPSGRGRDLPTTKKPGRTKSNASRMPQFEIRERTAPKLPEDNGAFRVLIAVHRPRFRGRAERAANLEGWEVTALLNKQDPVGQVQKPPRPPDILVLSHDFGRQKTLAIFRAVQKFREQGMTLVGIVEDCATAPEGFPDSTPDALCDVCVTPPITAANLRVVFSQIYEEKRGKPAPPPRSSAPDAEEWDEDDD